MRISASIIVGIYTLLALSAAAQEMGSTPVPACDGDLEGRVDATYWDLGALGAEGATLDNQVSRVFALEAREAEDDFLLDVSACLQLNLLRIEPAIIPLCKDITPANWLVCNALLGVDAGTHYVVETITTCDGQNTSQFIQECDIPADPSIDPNHNAYSIIETTGEVAQVTDLGFAGWLAQAALGASGSDPVAGPPLTAEGSAWQGDIAVSEWFQIRESHTTLTGDVCDCIDDCEIHWNIDDHSLGRQCTDIDGQAGGHCAAGLCDDAAFECLDEGGDGDQDNICDDITGDQRWLSNAGTIFTFPFEFTVCDASTQEFEKWCSDNCPPPAIVHVPAGQSTSNFPQLNADGDPWGDHCDEWPTVNNCDDVSSSYRPGNLVLCSYRDQDGDLLPDLRDNCPQVANTDQEDLNFNGQGDACEEPDFGNPRPLDPDALDFLNDAQQWNPDAVPESFLPLADYDNDGIWNRHELLFGTLWHHADTDDDGFGDGLEVILGADPVSAASIPPGVDPGTEYNDNCPHTENDDQSDVDGDGVGDACECGDANGDGTVNVGDILAINEIIFQSLPAPPLCDANNDGACNVGDILGVNAEIFDPHSAECFANQPLVQVAPLPESPNGTALQTEPWRAPAAVLDVCADSAADGDLGTQWDCGPTSLSIRWQPLPEGAVPVSVRYRAYIDPDAGDQLGVEYDGEPAEWFRSDMMGHEFSGGAGWYQTPRTYEAPRANEFSTITRLGSRGWIAEIQRQVQYFPPSPANVAEYQKPETGDVLLRDNDTTTGYIADDENDLNFPITFPRSEVVPHATRQTLRMFAGGRRCEFQWLGQSVGLDNNPAGYPDQWYEWTVLASTSSFNVWRSDDCTIREVERVINLDTSPIRQVPVNASVASYFDENLGTGEGTGEDTLRDVVWDNSPFPTIVAQVLRLYAGGERCWVHVTNPSGPTVGWGSPFRSDAWHEFDIPPATDSVRVSKSDDCAVYEVERLIYQLTPPGE